MLRSKKNIGRSSSPEVGEITWAFPAQFNERSFPSKESEEFVKQQLCDIMHDCGNFLIGTLWTGDAVDDWHEEFHAVIVDFCERMQNSPQIS